MLSLGGSERGLITDLSWPAPRLRCWMTPLVFLAFCSGCVSEPLAPPVDLAFVRIEGGQAVLGEVRERLGIPECLGVGAARPSDREVGRPFGRREVGDVVNRELDSPGRERPVFRYVPSHGQKMVLVDRHQEGREAGHMQQALDGGIRRIGKVERRESADYDERVDQIELAAAGDQQHIVAGVCPNIQATLWNRKLLVGKDAKSFGGVAAGELE